MDNFDDLSNDEFLDDLSGDSKSGEGEKAGGALGFREEFGFKEEGTWDETAYKADKGARDDYDYGDSTIVSRVKDFLTDQILRLQKHMIPEQENSGETTQEIDWTALGQALMKALLKRLAALLKSIASVPEHPFIKQFNRKQKIVLAALAGGVVLMVIFGYTVVSNGGFGGSGDEDLKFSIGQTGTAVFLEAKTLEEKLSATKAAATQAQAQIAITQTVSYRQTEYASLITPTAAFTLAPNATYGFGLTPTAADAETPVPGVTSLASGDCSCTGDLYQCASFSTHDEAQSCYEYCIDQGVGDIHNIDIDENGLACESLP